jgi:hypothetical protein
MTHPQLSSLQQSHPSSIIKCAPRIMINHNLLGTFALVIFGYGFAEVINSTRHYSAGHFFVSF